MEGDSRAHILPQTCALADGAVGARALPKLSRVNRFPTPARVAKPVDAGDLKSPGRKAMQVRVLLRALFQPPTLTLARFE